MTDWLALPIERTRNHQMSPEEKFKQEIEFSYGNAHFDSLRITREMVADRLSTASELSIGQASGGPAK